LNSAISLQQSVYYTAHHTLNLLLVANSKLLILLFCNHNKR